ncbi:MAG: TetR/AcrR family transcriptional regulator [Gammaproteobacteria bacterium]|nr:TetR/AcrR family transcriptional regulator [Gammaproteobacteria bacterium]
MQTQATVTDTSRYPLSRKQRELAKREALILDTAQNILHEQGYSSLTMDRIAEAIEYSKGTIYNHFPNKEDMVCSLCCRNIKNLIDIFTRAAEYEGTSRERFSAMGIGYSLYHQINPLDAQNIQIIKINSIREKISLEKLSEIESLEQRITEIANRVVQEAIQCGDLPKEVSDITDSIVFGYWSMLYGSLLLEQSDIPLENLGFNPGVKTLWLNCQKFMDGYNWLPHSPDIGSESLFNKISSDLYSNEVDMLNKRNK